MYNNLSELLNRLKTLSNDPEVPPIVRLKCQELQNEILKAIDLEKRAIDLMNAS